MAFLFGEVVGSIAVLPLGLLLAVTILRRAGAGIALSLFGLAGVLAQATALPPPPLLSRGTWILEGDISGTGDVLDLELTGAAPVGQPLAPVAGRMIALGRCSGSRVRMLAKTRTVAPFGFPGERAKAPHTIAQIERCLSLEPSVFAPIDRLRERMRAAIDRALPPDRAAVVRAMALGDRIRDRQDMRLDFADSGLAHVLAVSGQHLTIIASLFTVVLAALFARIAVVREHWGTRRSAALAAILLVAGYTVLVGAPPSAVRAAVMVGIMLIGTLLDRRREAWSALALALVLMIALEPPVLGSLSFQLSFAAVLGLLLLERGLKELLSMSRWPRLLRGAGAVAATSLAATLGTAPLLAHHFGRVSVIGLLANVPAAPIASLFLLPLSLLGSAAGAVSEPVGLPLLIAAGWAAEALIRLAHVAASAPAATMAVSALETVLLALAIYCLVTARRRLALTAALGLALAFVIGRPPAGGDLIATVLPVGQGTSVLVETPEGARVLVDTGPPDTAERSLLPYLSHRRIGHLDLVVLSHPHADHTGGFALLARRTTIDRVWTNGDRRDALPDLTRHRATTMTSTSVQIGGVSVEVLHSRSDAPRVNDGSIVLRITYGRRSLLLAGDAESAAEAEMAARSIAADVLIVGHHGSATSSSEEFLDAVRPSIAIIPVGRDNSFGHPHPSVVARLRGIGAQVFRTDLDGAVEVRTDGRSLAVRSLWPRSASDSRDPARAR